MQSKKQSKHVLMPRQRNRTAKPSEKPSAKTPVRKALAIGIENPVWKTMNVHYYANGLVQTVTSVRVTPSGAVVRVTTASPSGVSESLTYVPGANIEDFAPMPEDNQ